MVISSKEKKNLLDKFKYFSKQRDEHAAYTENLRRRYEFYTQTCKDAKEMLRGIDDDLIDKYCKVLSEIKKIYESSKKSFFANEKDYQESIKCLKKLNIDLNMDNTMN